MLLIQEVFGVVFLAFASAGPIVGALRARAKTRAIRTIGSELPDVAPSAEEPETTRDGPFRSPGVASPSERPERARRGGRLLRHDYDLMIGRTFFR